MFNPKWINPNYILVRINRKVQADKREKSGSILLHHNTVHMGFNQQMGEVLVIGSNVPKILPEIQVGDTALFSHVVEGTATVTDDNRSFRNEWLLYDADPVWRYYIVRCVMFTRDTRIMNDEGEVEEYGDPIARPQFLYGVIKQDGAIYMTDFYTLALASPDERDNRTMKRKEIIDVHGNKQVVLSFLDFKEERKQIEDRLADLKMEAETHKDRAEILMKEMEALTKRLNTKRAATFVPLFTPLKLRRDFGVPLDSTWILYYQIIGSNQTTPQVTQITIHDHSFYILRNDFILMAKKMSEETMRRLNGVMKEDEVKFEDVVI